MTIVYVSSCELICGTVYIYIYAYVYMCIYMYIYIVFRVLQSYSCTYREREGGQQYQYEYVMSKPIGDAVLKNYARDMNMDRRYILGKT